MTRLNVILVSMLAFFVLSCNEKSANETVEPNVPEPWVGYWQFENYPGPNERAYFSVPDDSGLDVMEKSQMLEFREDGFVREFFWNRCATEPVVPTGWKDGSWSQSGSDPVVLDLIIEGQARTYEILSVDETGLIVKSIQ